MLQNLVVHRQEVKTINWKQHLALVVTHPMVLENNEPVKLYAVKKHFKVLTEGPSDLFFDAEPEEKEQDEEEAPAIPLEVSRSLGSQRAMSMISLLSRDTSKWMTIMFQHPKMFQLVENRFQISLLPHGVIMACAIGR